MPIKKDLPHRLPLSVPRETLACLGGLSGMLATVALHPLDVLKVRMQICPQRLTTWAAYRHVTCCESHRSLYSGLGAALLRQATYTPVRLGVFYYLYDQHLNLTCGKPPSVEDKVKMGVYAGMAGALVGCPAEVVLIRKMGDGRMEAYDKCWHHCPRPYRGLIDGFRKIFRSDSICGFWRGALLTLARAALLNAVQIVTYTQVRESLSEQDVTGTELNLITAFWTSVVTALVTLPVDVIKTRYQYYERGCNYMDVWSCLMRERGVMGLFRGFTPYCIRLFAHTFITFAVLEHLIKMYHDSESSKKKC